MKRAQPPSNPLLAELKAVHATLRRDLTACRQLAAAAANGAPAAQLRSGVKQLKTRGPLFQLRANCIHHCHLVHAHHEGEDSGLFPTVRRAAPHLAGTIDKLRADHRVVSDLLDQVEGIARTVENTGPSRARLVDALQALSTTLLAHLDFEEKALGPVLATLSARR
jgi:Hemerythrin HHE cation binding domain